MQRTSSVRPPQLLQRLADICACRCCALGSTDEAEQDENRDDGDESDELLLDDSLGVAVHAVAPFVDGSRNTKIPQALVRRWGIDGWWLLLDLGDQVIGLHRGWVVGVNRADDASPRGG